MQLGRLIQQKQKWLWAGWGLAVLGCAALSSATGAVKDASTATKDVTDTAKGVKDQGEGLKKDAEGMAPKADATGQAGGDGKGGCIDKDQNRLGATGFLANVPINDELKPDFCDRQDWKQ